MTSVTHIKGQAHFDLFGLFALEGSSSSKINSIYSWKVGKKAIFNCHNGWEFPGEKIAMTTPVPFLPGVTRPARGERNFWDWLALY